MVRIPAGRFLMGSPPEEAGRNSDEGPQHEVTLEAFWLGETPITQAQWRKVAGWPKVERDLAPDPSRFKGDDRPVERVNWHEAIEFCRRLSAHTGKNYTLPSEAQWEYACRAGTTTPFHFGATISTEQANYDGRQAYADGPVGEYRQQTTDVASFPANDWGLHDMHGNVWEWCLDHWHGSYTGAPADGSAWLSNAGEDSLRLLRGGSWYLRPGFCRSAYRYKYHPNDRNFDWGFRVCLTSNPAPAASQEAMADAREESQAAAWGGMEPEQVLAVESLTAAIEPTPSVPALPLAAAYDCGDYVVIQATSLEPKRWAVRDGSLCLNFSGEWEPEPFPSSRSADFLARTRWPSAEAAWAALLAHRAAKGVQS
jgi:formylglycine-generating enzyme required for sulfatase activity